MKKRIGIVCIILVFLGYLFFISKTIQPPSCGITESQIGYMQLNHKSGFDVSYVETYYFYINQDQLYYERTFSEVTIVGKQPTQTTLPRQLKNIKELKNIIKSLEKKEKQVGTNEITYHIGDEKVTKQEFIKGIKTLNMISIS